MTEMWGGSCPLGPSCSGCGLRLSFSLDRTSRRNLLAFNNIQQQNRHKRRYEIAFYSLVLELYIECRYKNSCSGIQRGTVLSDSPIEEGPLHTIFPQYLNFFSSTDRSQIAKARAEGNTKTYQYGYELGSPDSRVVLISQISQNKSHRDINR